MTKNCKTCGKEFEISDFNVAGVDLAEFLTKCDPCSDMAEARDKAARRNEETRIRSEAVVPKLYRLTDENHPDYPQQAHDLGQTWAKGNRPASSFWFGIIATPGTLQDTHSRPDRQTPDFPRLDCRVNDLDPFLVEL